jgi:hypothetical protein
MTIQNPGCWHFETHALHMHFTHDPTNVIGHIPAIFVSYCDSPRDKTFSVSTLWPTDKCGLVTTDLFIEFKESSNSKTLILGLLTRFNDFCPKNIGGWSKSSCFGDNISR